MKYKHYFLSLFAVVPAIAFSEINIYVSPSGNDSVGNGTEVSQPFKTLSRATQEVRSLLPSAKENINVVLEDGVYRLTSPLVFTAADSGNDSVKVTYKARNKGKANISGGIEVKGWVDANGDGIWEAPVPAGAESRQLFVNGKLATRARSADGKGWSRDGGDGYYSAPPYVASLSNIQDVEIIVQFKWKQYRGKIDSINGNRVKMNQTFWDLATIGPFGIVEDYARHVSWIENAKELLDEENEWYLDSANGKLHYKPESNVNIHSATIILPVSESLISLDGASNLNFDGITFSDTTWNQPSGDTGYISIQSGSLLIDSDYKTIEDGFEALTEMPGGINSVNSSNILFSNNTFTRIGSTGIYFGSGSKENVIFNNTFDEISGSAIVLGDMQDHHASPSRLTKNNLIDNNTIRNIGLDYLDTAAIKFTYTDKTVVANNTIENVGYTGISMGWGWTRYDVEPTSFPKDFANKGYNSPTVVKNNIVFRNKISKFAIRLGDAGGVYNLGASPKGRIVENLIFDTQPPKEGSSWINSVYLDNGSRGLQVDRNGGYQVSDDDPRNHGIHYNPGRTNIGNIYNTIGSNTLFDGGKGSADDMPDYLMAAGADPLITSPRTIKEIEALLPPELVDVPDAEMPKNGMLVGYEASATSNSNNATNIIDGNVQTYWAAGYQVNTGEIIIDTESKDNLFTGFVIAFGEVIDGKEVYHRHGRSFTIESSDDRENWTVLVDHSKTASSKRAIFANYIDPINARYLKITAQKKSGSDNLGILRFKAYGSKGLSQSNG